MTKRKREGGRVLDEPPLKTRNKGPQPDDQEKSGARTPAFSRIYFDTSVLRRHRWPDLSSSLRNILTVAQSVAIPCVIPVPVLIELEEWWISEFAERRDRVVEHSAAIQSVSVPLPAEARASYAAFVDRLIAENSLGIAPLTSQGLDRVFRTSAAHLAPFEQNPGFRDGVIQLSILEDLARYENVIAAVVSEDRGFRDQATTLASREGAGFEIFSDLQTLRDALEKRVSHETAKKIEHDRRLLRAAIEKEETWAGIVNWVKENFRLSVQPSVRAINGIVGIQLLRVESAFPPDRTEGQELEVSFDLEISVAVTVLRWVSRDSEEKAIETALGVGERNPVPSDATFLTSRVEPGFSRVVVGRSDQVEEDEVQKVEMRVRAKTRFSGGTYTDVKPISISAMPKARPWDTVLTRSLKKLFASN